MIFCSKCGAQNADDMFFCGKCASPLNAPVQGAVNAPMQSAMPNYSPPQFESKPEKKKKWPIILIGTIIIIVLAYFFSSDADDETPDFGNDFAPPSVQTPAPATPAASNRQEEFDGTWAIYWYLCGSDLETDAGFASGDLEEMMRVSLPENVTAVIELGGANYWHNGAEANSNTRYLYDSGGLTLLEQMPSANMGESRTFENFLRFCNTNYPADRQVLIIWNHGGGSVAGVAFDERYFFDSLTLPEMRSAFEAVHTISKENPPYELVGFDACFMATIDVADMLNGVSRYMVASQEWEPGLGWDYEGLFEALADNPGMSGAELGVAICDTYYAACVDESSWLMSYYDDATLSVVDLSRVDALMSAYYDIGAESLIGASATPSYFSEYGRAARNALNYGSNNDWDGYTNMVDLGDLVRQAGINLLPEYGQALLDALGDCVIYQVTGPLKSRASGLSKYYNYDGDYANFMEYVLLRDDDPFHWFYDFLLTGGLSAEGERYVLELARRYSGPQEIKSRSIPNSLNDGLEDFPLAYTDDGYVILELGANIADKLFGVYCYVAYYDDQSETTVLLGRDNELYADWENGVFMDDFRGVWGGIDGNLVYMELTDEADDFQLYTVPVLLNGEEYSLRVSYMYDSAEYKILGARRGIDEHGMSDKNLRQLAAGDVVEPLHFVLFDADDEDFSVIAAQGFSVTANTRFEETSLGDGIYIFMFEMIDALSNSFLSEAAAFELEGGEIYLLYD
ncbi:MAG: clostripain-related cysteine peptidase [Oscillospiraceae bacterium]|nr:clostripain-related cysteine peptidase [Oscillospiraceae bacterium]